MKIKMYTMYKRFSFKPIFNIDNIHFYENLVNMAISHFLPVSKQVVLPSSQISLCKYTGLVFNRYFLFQVVKVLFLFYKIYDISTYYKNTQYFYFIYT